ncbi:hypothetical protein WI90_14215 [Burkholderia ubonensis]|uniref:phage tail tape measure protein n=1 Tax=Burkholderia ubonensis TaxID=101571 RepID=UPI0007576083|nr:phage tail tape measure protein [Burkholderia ubonensis]KVD91564.1 hypothetical protein WI90_14215 [Burkholderia ubonensis]
MDITTLGVALDTSDLKQGESVLNSAAGAANKAADAMDAAGGSAARMASSYSGLSETTQRVASSMDPYLTALQQEYDLLGLSRSESEAYIVRARGMSESEQQIAAALGGKIDAWNREEDAARRAAAAEEALIASGQRFLASLQQQADTLGMSGAELAAYQGRLRGLTETQVEQAASLAAKVDAWKADAAAASAAAEAEDRAKQVTQDYLGALQREVDLLGATSAEKEAYIAKEKGLSAVEQQVAVSLRAQVDAFNQAAAAERAEATAKDQAAKAADSFIASLKSQVDAMGKSSMELLKMKAAALGVGDQAAPLIAQLEGAGKAAGFLGNSTAYARTEMLRLVNDVANGNWRRFEQTGMVLAEQYDMLGKLMTPVGLAVGGLTLAIGASAAAAIHAAESLAQYGGVVTHLHLQTGVSTDEIQRFTYAMTVVSGSGKDAGIALESLAKSIGRAQQGAGRTLGDFASLGISMKDLKSLGFDEVLGKIADKFSQTADDANKFTVAQQLFGGAAKDMVALLDRGSQGLAELGVQAQNAGAVLDRETIAKMYELDEELNTIHANFDAVSMQAKSTLVPTLVTISGAIADISKEGGAMNFFFEVAKGVMVGAASVGTIVVGTLQGIGTSLATLGQVQQDVLTGQFSQASQDAKKGYDDLIRQAQGYSAFLEKLWSESTGPGESPVDLGNGPGWGGGDRIELHGRKTGGARTNDNAVNADLADLQNQQKMIEDELKGSLEHIKSLRMQGVIDQKTALDDSYNAEQDALQKRIGIDQQMLELAKGKKNTEAYRKYADDIQRLQAQMALNDQKHADAVSAAAAQEAKALTAYGDTLAEQVKAQQAAASTKLAGLSMGGVAFSDQQELDKLQSKYDRDAASLRRSAADHPDRRGDVDRELTMLKGAHDQEVAIAKQSAADIKAANADWTTGATKAIADYGDKAENVASATRDAFTNAFTGMEDAFASFVTTGKLSFTNLANSILTDLARIEARKAISGLLSYGESELPGLWSSAMAAVTGTRASGGTVDGDGTYLVGENGPELFRPGTSGTIIPNNAISSSGSGGGSSTITVTVPVSVQGNASQSDQQHAGELSMKIKQAVQAVMQNELRQGGVLWKMNNRVS